jgi:hypothetical protein
MVFFFDLNEDERCISLEPPEDCSPNALFIWLAADDVSDLFVGGGGVASCFCMLILLKVMGLFPHAATRIS